MLANLKVTKGVEYELVWVKEEESAFSVKSCFNVISASNCTDSMDPSHETTFGALWSSLVPMKIKVFSWKSHLNRLTTIDLLHARGITSSPHDLPCILCFRVEENLQHIFFECGAVLKIWEVINSWTGVPLLDGENITCSFLVTRKSLRGKVKKNK